MARTSRAEWAKRVERWKDSGLTAKEFSAETGVKASTLTYWSWKLGAGRRQAEGRTARASSRRARDEAMDEPRGKFIALSAATAHAAPSVLEVVLRGDVRVRVPAGFDEATLVSLVRALDAAR